MANAEAAIGRKKECCKLIIIWILNICKGKRKCNLNHLCRIGLLQKTFFRHVSATGSKKNVRLRFFLLNQPNNRQRHNDTQALYAQSFSKNGVITLFTKNIIENCFKQALTDYLSINIKLIS
jgi:hypothetical protein